MNNSIEDFLKTLSKEEQEAHKELISECLEREKMLDNFDVSKFCEAMGNLINNIEKVSEEVKKANRDLEDCKDKMLLSKLKVKSDTIQ